MRLLITFTRAYPWQTAVMLVALLLAGIAEGSSLSALLPLLSFVIQQEKGATGAEDAAVPEDDSGFGQIMTNFLTSIGIQPSVGVLLVVIVIGITLKSVLVLFATKRVGYTAAQVTTDLRLALLRALLSTRWDYYLHQPIGRLANSMATEAIRAAESYVYATTLASVIIQATVYTGVALMVSWKATVASFAAGTGILLASHFLVRMSRRAGKRQTKLLISLLARLTDTLQSVKPLKAMARENLADTVLVAETDKLNNALRKEVFSKAALNAAQEPMFAVVIAFGIFVLLQHWGMPLASVMVLVLVLAKVLNQMGKVQKQYQKMVTAESAFWSLRGAIDEAERARETLTGEIQPDLKSRIEIDDVSFAFGEKEILSELTMEIPAGSLTALVGPSGGGKTTVVDLVLGLHRPAGGELRIDGVPLEQIKLKAWRNMIGYVPQETVLLHDSIFNNVTLGDPDLDERQAEQALRAAGAWEFISAMPGGLHGIAGERGTKLSGGQRQRIMIARALVHRPRLLILDEATTALDPESEAAICATLQDLRGELTILAISHQPAIVDAADRVYRLQDGQARLEADHSASGYLPQPL